MKVEGFASIEGWMSQINKDHKETNKFIQDLLDLLVEAKEAHHKLAEANKDLNEKMEELQWEVNCLKRK